MSDLHAALDFGISPSVADNSDGLALLRNTLLTDRHRMWRVTFPAGLIRYTNNDWLTGVGRVTIDGYGTEFQCTSPSDWFHAFTTFAPKAVFQTWGRDQEFVGELTPGLDTARGNLIHSVAAGAREVEFFSTLPDEPIEPGDVVLIAGYNQQLEFNPTRSWGWPPNHRWFEFCTVVAQDGHTLRLRDALRHSYDRAWPDYTLPEFYGRSYVYGAPRLFRCNRPGYDIIKHLEIRGASFIGHPNRPNAQVVLPGALITILEDCAMPDSGGSIAPSQGGLFVMRRCAFENVEVDKQLEHVTIEGCKIRNDLTGDSAGCERLDVTHTRIDRQFRCVSRGLRIEAVNAREKLFNQGAVIA